MERLIYMNFVFSTGLHIFDLQIKSKGLHIVYAVHISVVVHILQA